MKLTNKIIDVTSNVLYKEITVVNEAVNKQAIDNVKLAKNNSFVKLISKIEDLDCKISSMHTERRELGDKLQKLAVEKFGENAKNTYSCSPNYTHNIITDRLKKEKVSLKPTPSKTELEEFIILNSDKDISELLESIKSKFE